MNLPRTAPEGGPIPGEGASGDWTCLRVSLLIERGVLFVRNGYPEGTHNESGDGVPHLRPFNVGSDGRIDLSQMKCVKPPPKESLYWLRPGDVIFNNTNSEDLVGKTAFLDLYGDFVLSNHMTIIRVLDRHKIEPYWLAQHLYWKWTQGVFRQLCRRHVNQASVSLERLKGVEIELPSIDEQKAIASVLLAIQRAKEASEKVIAATRQLKASLMKYLFAYGPVPFDQADKVPLKQTEIGPIPDHWAITNFSDVAQIASGQVDPRQAPYCEMLHVGPENIESESGCLMNLQTAEQLRLISGKYLFTEADVLYSKIRPYLRKAAIPDFTGTCSADMYPLRTTDLVKKGFLFYWLLSDGFTQQAVSHQSRTGIPKVNREQLNSTQMPVPSNGEQIRIITILSSVRQKVGTEENRKRQLEALFKSLLHHLMTGKIRVPVTEAAGAARD